MKKKFIVLSLLLIGMAIFLISTSTNANAFILPGHWTRDQTGQIDGCGFGGAECGVNVNRPILIFW